MMSSLLSCLKVAMVFGILCLSVMGQSGANLRNSPGKTPAEALREYGIDLSEPSLITALANANSRVRTLAANQLASDGDSDAIPAIKGALSNERDPRTRVGIAAALSALHDQAGVDTLQAICSDTTLPIRVITEAVWALQVLSAPRGNCSEAVLRSLTKPSDRDYLDSTLGLLPMLYAEASSTEAQQMVETLEKLIGDKNQQPSVRMGAGNALAEIGAPASMDVVEKAISNEDDPGIRASLQINLDTLKKKQM